MKKSRIQKLIFVILLVTAYSCGDKQLMKTATSSGEDAKTIDEPGQLTVLPVTEGMNGEATVGAEANSFPEGTTITAEGVDSPLQFVDNSAGSNLNSGALKISAVLKDEELEDAAAPMTISIPTNVETSLLLQESDANLCVFLIDTSGKLFVWRKTDFVSIEAKSETETDTGTFQTTKLGTYQLSKCGSSEITGFAEAKASGISGAASLSDSLMSTSSFTCSDETKSVFEDYSSVTSCESYLTSFKSCTCETIEGLTQEECSAKITTEIKNQVCVDSNFEVDQTKKDLWAQGCDDSIGSLKESYSEICTFE